MAVALIQGASKGLGLQFSKVLTARADVAKVIATSRGAENEAVLLDIQKQFPKKLVLINVDITKEDNIKRIVPIITEKSGGKLDLVLNCSAILHPSGKGETSLRDVSFEGLRSTFETNTIGPLLTAKYFSPLLLKSSGLFGNQSGKKHSGILVNMTAKVSSISDNQIGGWYSYRLSKTALNMATKNLSIELGRGKSKVICVAMHPGTVDTDLSRPYHKGVPADKLFSAEKSVNFLMTIIDKLSVEDTGKCIGWDGNIIPY
ncbi:C-factor-like [Daphnia pulex]|uniref:C-factor-like n=1 Tax=Daphnia pulex TaxID=6669 RepID=UPI001EDFE64C|nr:C-factor-like [Daphnia pulex]